MDSIEKITRSKVAKRVSNNNWLNYGQVVL